MPEHPISSDEARAALATIHETTQQARRWLAHSGVGYYLVLWGSIWALGFLASYIFGETSRLAARIWSGLSGLGVLISFGMGFYFGQRAPSPRGMRLGLYWLAWILYASLIIAFAHPQSAQQQALLISLFAMMGYVTTGLLLDSRFLGLLGLGLTALLVVGYLAFPNAFALWTAFFGGGGMIAAGMYILRQWRA